MISVCIPVYNHLISTLVNRFTELGTKSDTPLEIIVIDDKSDDYYREENRNFLVGVKYVELDKNIGRSKIRNLFPLIATYDILLYVDCDSEIPSENFIENYLTGATMFPGSVICGGRVYNRRRPPLSKRLRWRYGQKRETVPAGIRSADPYRYFMTNNFLIEKDLIKKVQFDDRLEKYGYEDTLFGFELMKRGISVKHLDNPLLHNFNETNSEYLEKVENGVENLIKITQFTGYDPRFISSVKILRVYHRLKNSPSGQKYFPALYRLIPSLKRVLESGLAGMVLFDLYRLLLLFKYDSNNNN